MKVKVIKEHSQTKDLFPLGFETTCEVNLTSEDKTYEGFYTSLSVLEKTKGGASIMVKKSVWVEGKTIPKGTFKNLLLIGINGETYSSDWFYDCTGKSIPEFFDIKL